MHQCYQAPQRNYTGLAIGLSLVSAFAPMLYQQRQYAPYQSYTPYQPVQWGTPFDGVILTLLVIVVDQVLTEVTTVVAEMVIMEAVHLRRRLH